MLWQGKTWEIAFTSYPIASHRSYYTTHLSKSVRNWGAFQERLSRSCGGDEEGGLLDPRPLGPAAPRGRCSPPRCWNARLKRGAGPEIRKRETLRGQPGSGGSLRFNCEMRWPPRVGARAPIYFLCFRHSCSRSLDASVKLYPEMRQDSIFSVLSRKW